jgi:hypothetical protein
MTRFFRINQYSSKFDFKNLLSLRLSFKNFLKRFFIIFIVAPLALLSYFFITLPQPVITLQIPKADQIATEKELYIQGKIKPNWAQVQVNGKSASINGDGTFTLLLPVNIGKNILKLQASYFGKNAEYLVPITRELSQGERIAQAQEQQKEEAEARQRVLAADTKINDLLDQSNSDSLTYIVQVITHSIKKDSIFSRIVGEVTNMTLDPVYWVKITAKFYNASDQLIDTKEGFAVSQVESISPGKTHDFMTQATDKQFAYYKLSTDWTTTQFSSTTSASFDAISYPSPSISPTKNITPTPIP